MNASKMPVVYINNRGTPKPPSRPSNATKSINILNDRSKVFGVGVVSWNIGRNVTHEKISQFVDEMLDHGKNKPDLLIIGFQELDRDEARLTELLREHLISYNYRDMYSNMEYIDNKSACTPPFKIKTYVFYEHKLARDIEYDIESSHPVCDGIVRGINFGTKGFLHTRVVANGIPINFVNTHMPFKSENASVEFYTNMMRALRRYDNEMMFVFGDVNSRSLLTKECYKKDVEACRTFAGGGFEALERFKRLNPFRRDRDGMYENKDASFRSYDSSRQMQYPLENTMPDDDSGYCKLKAFLESADFEMTVGSVLDSGSGNIASACRASNGMSCSISENEIDGEYLSMLRILRSRDMIGNPPCHPSLFTGFLEMPIEFLPTYKRDKVTGMFQLSKVEKVMGFIKTSAVRGRLPGYADRIFYRFQNNKRGSIVEGIHYTSFPVIGNDHMPVTALFQIKGSQQSSQQSSRQSSQQSSQQSS